MGNLRPGPRRGQGLGLCRLHLVWLVEFGMEAAAPEPQLYSASLVLMHLEYLVEVSSRLAWLSTGVR